MGKRMQSRRQFLATGAGGLLGMAALQQPWLALAAKKTADSVHGPIRITDIEKHEIHPDYVDWLHYELNHFYGPTKRSVYVVHTNKGLQGLGEGRKEPDAVLENYIRNSHVYSIGDDTSIPLSKATYDLMGEAAEVTVYKLFDQR